MPFSKEQLEKVSFGVDRALSSGSLTGWERRFLTDMKAKLQRYGTKTVLTDKQYAKLMQLARPAPANVGAVPKSSPGPKARSKRRPPFALRRTARRLSRGLLRDLALVAALIGVVVLFQISQSGLDRFGSVPDPAQSSAEITARQIKVVDGDTIRVSGEGRRVRLVGFNTPEVFSPKCAREERIGRQATARLSELLRTARSIEFEKVRCSYPPGTEGTRRCNYGRSCGSLRVDGRDVGDVLIREGLAVPYICGRTSCPPRPGDWCSG